MTQVFDLVVGVYGQMLNGAYAALTPAALGLLVVCAIFQMRVGLMWASVDGFWNLPRVVAVVAGVGIQVGVTALLITQMNGWTTDAMNRMLDWSGRATGLINARQIIWNRPSTLVDTGFILAAGLKPMMRSGGPLDAVVYTVLYFGVVIFFGLIALTVMLVQVEWRIATVTAVIFLPWILLRWTLFMGSGVIHWLGGTAAKVFTLGLCVAGVIILVGLIPPINSTAGMPPTYDDAASLTLVAFVCFAIAWFLPAQVGHRFGGGGSMSAGQVLAGPLAVFGASSAAIGASSAAIGVVRSVSSLIRRR